MRTTKSDEILKSLIEKVDELEAMFVNYSQTVGCGDLKYLEEKSVELEEKMKEISEMRNELKSCDRRDVSRSARRAKIDIDEFLTETINALSMVENGIEIVRTDIFEQFKEEGK